MKFSDIIHRISLLRRADRVIPNNGRCLAVGCNNANDEKLFIIALESETITINKLLSLECLCEDCALLFLDDFMKQCTELARRLLANDYVIETNDIYEQTILQNEILIQEAVKTALAPEFTLPTTEELH